MDPCPLSHKYELLLKALFNQMCSNVLYIKKIINSNPFVFLIINVKFLFNFQKEWYTFGRKKDI